MCIRDRSKDKTGEIADKYAKMDDRIIVVDQNNGGLPNARNTGMKYAHGEYVMFLDSDDRLEMTCCETAIRELQNENADIIFFEYYKEYRLSLIHISVCGDHISPISDTTIMSSSGAQSNHINHVPVSYTHLDVYKRQA